MINVIDTRDWPLVAFTLPSQVADEDAEAVLSQISAIYQRAEPFVLLMDGVEMPRQSALFLSSYLRWSKEHHAVQQRYCRGAIRVEADNDARAHYQQRAADYAASGQAAYPYHVVATAEAARQLAATLLQQP